MKNKKSKVTSQNIEDLLLESMDQDLLHSQGKVTLKKSTCQIPGEPPEYSKNKIKNIRERLLEVSQPVFASILGCTPSAVKYWERGQNKPRNIS